jgi:hypothetical protein
VAEVRVPLLSVMIRSRILVSLLFASFLWLPQAKGEGVSLAGAWSGGGTVIYSSGERERARCTAHYSGGGARITVTATCATPSGSVSQTASLRKTGANSYSGTFFNSQFNVSGSIHVTVHGNTQSVSLRSGSGSASLTLRH